MDLLNFNVKSALKSTLVKNSFLNFIIFAGFKKFYLVIQKTHSPDIFCL